MSDISLNSPKETDQETKPQHSPELHFMLALIALFTWGVLLPYSLLSK